MQEYDKNGQHQHFAILMNSQMSIWQVSMDQKWVLIERLREVRVALHQDLRQLLLDTLLKRQQNLLHCPDLLKILGRQFLTCSVEHQLRVASVQLYTTRAQRGVVSHQITLTKTRQSSAIWLFACFQNNQCLWQTVTLNSIRGLVFFRIC